MAKSCNQARREPGHVVAQKRKVVGAAIWSLKRIVHRRASTVERGGSNAVVTNFKAMLFAPHGIATCNFAPLACHHAATRFSHAPISQHKANSAMEWPLRGCYG